MEGTNEATRKTRMLVSDAEFRGETIYFIVVDRFHSGNQQNNGENDHLNDPTRKDWGKYWGGDLQGILDKLDYLQGLGVTALWLTPLFEQIEWLTENRAPIHGYWTKDFKRINSRWVNDPSEIPLFTRNDTVFDRLIAALHERGMKLVLDIVCNHSSPSSEGGKGKLYDDGKLVADFDDDKQNWYHHYGITVNWEDDWQVQNCELEGLATFNENNILFRRYVKDALKMWLDKGVDTLRVDTVKHMPLWFWQELTADLQSHKPDTFMFGEWYLSHPGNQKSVDFANHSGMSMLDFGLCYAIRACLGEKKTDGFRIVQEIYDQDPVYRGATELVTFFENHDMPRLLSIGADGEDLYLAMALLQIGRGIPCFYYGCEQYLHNATDGGGDPYNRPMMEKWDTQSPLYRLVGILAKERHENPALKWGCHQPLFVNEDFYAFARIYRGNRGVLFLNRGAEREIQDFAIPLADGEHECLLTSQRISVVDQKLKTFKMPARSALYFRILDEPVTGKAVARVQLNGVQTQPGQRLVVTGDIPELGKWDIREVYPLEFVNANTWFGEIPFNESVGQPLAYKYVILEEGENRAPIRENRVARRRQLPPDGEIKWRDVWEA